MMKNRSVCQGCGYTSLPVGARFCPHCGINLSLESEDINTMDTPMATAVPLSYAFPESSGDTTRGEVLADASYGSTISIPTTINTNPEPRPPNPDGSIYYKNPTREILKNASNHHIDFGILFIKTSCKSGKFTVPRVIDVFSVLNGLKIDLSVADFVHATTTIRIVPSIMSGLKIIVPRGVRVEVKGLGIMGEMKGLQSQNIHAGQDGPLLLVQGVTVMGAVVVKVNEKVPSIQIVH